MWLDDLQIFVHVNDEEVYTGGVEEVQIKLVDKKVKTWREFANAKDNEAIVMGT